jgi:tetratricopeptide (TPR) repeat protein
MTVPLNLFYARHRVAIICLGLALVTMGLYWPVTHHEFINVDDPRFVTENPHVLAGVSWAGICWAFQSVYTEAWQPVTWISHMLDCDLYGVKAGGHHFTSLLFHIANTLLLFLWLNELTKATGRSAFVAAFFAWHPLHVESVAWACERKDVLGAFFWLLALMAYTRYVRKPRVGAYLLVLGLFALGLMSKPTVITLPFVLLLLDFWPFNRFGVKFMLHGEPISKGDDAAGPGRFIDKSSLRKTVPLICEKIPFFVLALGMSAAALFAQKAGGSLASIAGLPMHVRAANALASYLSYLSKTFWPSGLAYFYPYSFDIPLVSVLGSALLLMVWTIWFVMRARQQPWLLTGWFWFLGTLVPTIGLVQFCIQAKADRYTYIPSIGLFLVIVWGLNDLFSRWPARRKLLPVIGGLALAGCVGASSVQLGYWQNNLTVARHAIEVTDGNYVAYESLGEAIGALGQPERATNFFAEAVRMAPSWPQGQFNFGITLSKIGQTNDAIEHLEAGVKLVPDFPEGHYLLGQTLLKFGKTDEAIREFTGELKLTPGDARAHYRLALALEQQGDFAGAARHCREALRLTPNYPEARAALDQILSAHPGLK